MTGKYKKRIRSKNGKRRKYGVVRVSEIGISKFYAMYNAHAVSNKSVIQFMDEIIDIATGTYPIPDEEKAPLFGDLDKDE